MIQIKLDKDIKKQIKGLHWLWFWKRLNDKELHLTTGTVSAYQFLHNVLGWNKQDFCKIVLSEYADLSEYIKKTNGYNITFKNAYDDATTKYTLYKWDKTIPGYGNETEEKFFKDLVFDCFGYKDFRSGKYSFGRIAVSENVKKWSAYSLVDKMKIEVCPYCNKEYIPIIKTNGKFRAEIDHFFPEAEYPYLSCSLFNFIPSCSICNHHKNASYNKYDKKNNIKLTIYPYTEGFEEIDGNGKIKKNAVFKAIPGSGDLYKSKEIELKYNNPLLEDKMKKSNDAFLIEELYNTCTTELEDLLTRYRNYAEPKINDIVKNLSVGSELATELESLSISDSEKNELLNKVLHLFNKSMRNQILGIPLNSSGQKVDKEYPFRKFKNDIIEQLDKWVDQKKRRTI